MTTFSSSTVPRLQLSSKSPEGAQALPCRASELEVHAVVRQAALAEALGDRMAERRADRAVRVHDRQVEPDALAALQLRHRQLDQLVVEGELQPVVLLARAVDL